MTCPRSHALATLSITIIMVSTILVQVLSIVPEEPYDTDCPISGHVKSNPVPKNDASYTLPSPIATEKKTLNLGLDGCFIENRGQLSDGQYNFYALGEPLSVFFGTGGLTFTYMADKNRETSSYKVHFDGANPISPTGRQSLDQTTNFMHGTDENAWVLGARSYHEVVYEGLWESIDLRFLFREGLLKYEFTVRPEGDINDIKMFYEYVGGLRISPDDGKLEIDIEGATILDDAPIAYQFPKGTMTPVEVSYSIVEPYTIGYSIGTYNAAIDLVIDPGLEFSTYFGGSDDEYNYGTRLMIVDDDGNIIIAGRSLSPDLPSTVDAYCRTYAVGWGHDIFVAKLNADATSLIYCTYLGGTSADFPNAMDVDENGRVVVVGATNSTNIPVTSGAYSKNKGVGYDCYLAVLDDNCSVLTFASYLGGTHNQECLSGIVRDSNNDYIITGLTNSSEFPTTEGAYCRTVRNGDVAVMKISSDNWDIEFSTFIGGSGQEWDVACEKAWILLLGDGNFLITASSGSLDFPMTGAAFDNSANGMYDAVLCVLSSDGKDLLRSTYFGGKGRDGIDGIAVDSNGDIWFAGSTASNDLPVTLDALQSEYGGASFGQWTGDTYIVKMDSNLSKVLYCSYYGSSESDFCSGIQLDSEDNPIISIATGSDELITPRNAYQSKRTGSGECYLLWMNSKGTSIINATYIGGSLSDYSSSITVIDAGIMLLFGITQSLDFPITPGCYDSSAAPNDAFITAISMTRSKWAPPGAPSSLVASPRNGALDLSWGLPAGDWDYPIKQYQVFLGDSPTSLAYHAPTASTHYTVTGLTNGKTYYVGIIAKNIVGEGPMSAVVSAIPYAPPSEPQSFMVLAGFHNVTLSWTAPMFDGGYPIQGYRIYRGEDEEHMSLLTSVGNVTSYIDEWLNLGQRYFYGVMAYHQMANGTFSETWSAVPFGLPGPPMSFNAIADDRKVQLSWRPPMSDGGAPIRGFRIYRGYSESATEPLSIVKSTEYLDDSVVNGVAYYYSIKAFNDAGDGPNTDVLAVTPMGLPDPPEDLTIESGDGWLKIGWQPPIETGGSTITGYRILRGMMPDSLSEIGIVGNVTEYNDTGRTNGVTYYYAIRSRTRIGESQSSLLVQAMPVGPPTAPVGLIVEASRGQLTLSWITPENDGGTPITRYAILRGASSDSLLQLIEIGPTATNFIDTQVAIGHTYFYSVIAFNNRFNGPPSNIADGIPYDLPMAPLAPKAELVNGTILLSWAAPESDGGRSIVDYVIYRGSLPSAMLRVANVGPIRMYVDRNPRYGETYYYSVAAVNLAGEGEVSDVVKITPTIPLYVPGIPLSLSASDDGTSARIVWAPPTSDGGSPITGYVIMRGFGSDNLTVLTEVGAVLFFIDEDLEKGATYRYAVAARNSVGVGEPTEPVIVEIEQPSAIVRDQDGLLLLSIIVAIVVALLVALAFVEPWRYALVMLMLPLLSKLAKDKLLEHKVRYAIQGIIIEKPGIHYSAIMEELGLTNGVAAYHLDVLEREHFVRSMNDGRFKRFFSVDAKVPTDFRMSPEQIRKRLLALVGQKPGIAQKEIIQELGIDRETVGYHLRELVKDSRLDAQKDGKYTTYRVPEWVPQ